MTGFDVGYFQNPVGIPNTSKIFSCTVGMSEKIIGSNQPWTNLLRFCIGCTEAACAETYKHHPNLRGFILAKTEK